MHPTMKNSPVMKLPRQSPQRSQKVTLRPRMQQGSAKMNRKKRSNIIVNGDTKNTLIMVCVVGSIVGAVNAANRMNPKACTIKYVDDRSHAE